MNLNEINSNILLHCGGRCGSHRFADLIIANNENMVVHVPGIDQPIFEYHFVKEWAHARHVMREDLCNLNRDGKYWMIKTGGMSSIVEMFRAVGPSTEIGLVRANIVDTVYSHVVADLLDHYHYIAELPQDDYGERLFDQFCQDPDAVENSINAAVAGTASINFNILLLWLTGGQNFPIYTYEDITQNTNKHFENTQNQTTFTSAGFLDNPVQRLVTPKFPEFHHEVAPMIQEKLYPGILNSLNSLSDVTFTL